MKLDHLLPPAALSKAPSGIAGFDEITGESAARVPVGAHHGQPQGRHPTWQRAYARIARRRRPEA
jgi:hypothetical protein